VVVRGRGTGWGKAASGKKNGFGVRTEAAGSVWVPESTSLPTLGQGGMELTVLEGEGESGVMQENWGIGDARGGK